MTALGLKSAELSILLCDDRTIHELNHRYRHKNRPTDVLAFPIQSSRAPNASILLGDVVISVQTARRQALSKKWSLTHELTFLLAHGLLHLLGFDHKTDAEERRMTARTHVLTAAAERLPRTIRGRQVFA